MESILFATHNAHKAQEVSAILGFPVKTLADAGITDEIPETGHTLRENALIKASYLHARWEIPVFADDSGLEVTALHGAPGVFSARFAGEHGNHNANNAKLLHELENKSDRAARFVTVICLILKGEPVFFEGEIRGKIARELSGATGFGYDPLFIPEGYDRTFAELGADVKNRISHRARAVEKLALFLQGLQV